jgi:hypothetical protein
MVDEIQKITLSQTETEQKKPIREDKPENKSGKKRKFKLKYVFIPLLVLFLLLLLVGLPTFVLVRPLIVSGQKTYNLVQEAYQAGKNQDLVLTAEKLAATEESLKETEQKYKKLIWLKAIPLAGGYYNDGQHGFKAALEGIAAARILVDAIEPYADVLGFKGQGSFMGGTAEDRIVKIVQTMDKITPKLDEVSQKLNLVQEELDQIKTSRYPNEFKGNKIREKLETAKTAVDDIAADVDQARPILTVLPQILGYPNPQDYLVIFQNDGELRATGGFMTAFSVMHLESGKIKPEQSNDIYYLDRKFKTRLKPPDPIKEYLFSNEFGRSIVPYYYLRDMNFSPDFKTSMSTFKQYYDEIPGEYEVQGIITLDTYVLKDLVDILGPINVPEYGEFTNEPDKRCHGLPNIICELEYIVDQPLPTEAASRKEAILGPMMKELLLRSMGAPKNLWPKLFSTALRLIKEKHILLYFEAEEIQKAAEAFNAAGRIKEFDGDYLHINDSNFGGAKSNTFTHHTVEQEIEIDEVGKITKTLTMVYENPEPMDNCNLERTAGLCLNSILRNYFRIYVPAGSKLIEGLGSEVEMTTGEELGKTYFDGFLTVRGEGGRAKVVVKYELPFTLQPGDNYRLLIQKQAGTLGHKYKVIFGDQEEEFDLRTDREIEFEF